MTFNETDVVVEISKVLYKLQMFFGNMAASFFQWEASLWAVTAKQGYLRPAKSCWDLSKRYWNSIPYKKQEKKNHPLSWRDSQPFQYTIQYVDTMLHKKQFTINVHKVTQKQNAGLLRWSSDQHVYWIELLCFSSVSVTMYDNRNWWNACQSRCHIMDNIVS